jgi:hypothetical protein
MEHPHHSSVPAPPSSLWLGPCLCPLSASGCSCSQDPSWADVSSTLFLVITEGLGYTKVFL